MAHLRRHKQHQHTHSASTPTQEYDSDAFVSSRLGDVETDIARQRIAARHASTHSHVGTQTHWYIALSHSVNSAGTRLVAILASNYQHTHTHTHTDELRAHTATALARTRLEFKVRLLKALLHVCRHQLRRVVVVHCNAS
jgi:hypothetical protein